MRRRVDLRLVPCGLGNFNHSISSPAALYSYVHLRVGHYGGGGGGPSRAMARANAWAWGVLTAARGAARMLSPSEHPAPRCGGGSTSIQLQRHDASSLSQSRRLARSSSGAPASAAMLGVAEAGSSGGGRLSGGRERMKPLTQLLMNQPLALPRSHSLLAIVHSALKIIANYKAGSLGNVCAIGVCGSVD